MAFDKPLVAALRSRLVAATRKSWPGEQRKQETRTPPSAAAMSLAACRAAALNVETNVAGLSDPKSQKQMLEKTRDLLARTEESATHANAAALDRVKPVR